MTFRLGLDLDNTLISYDRAFLTAARQRGLVPSDFTGNKQQVRDFIRALHQGGGEVEWQRLQGFVYGAGIDQAELFPGVKSFLTRAKGQGCTLYIVSHKTEYGHYDPARVNLRNAAKSFLKKEEVCAFVPEEHVFFAATRREKIQKIVSLRCEMFIDDLEEVFADPAFPPDMRRLLFAAVAPATMPGLEACASWPEIEKRLFDANPH